jgi:Flp pilus assembly protein TadB
MAQTRRKRKHRGTQAGTVEARGRTSRPSATRADARHAARDRRTARLDRPPTWRSSLNRAAISAAVFAVAVVLLFKQSVASGLVLGVVMVVVYLPMSYYTDRFMYNRRQRRKRAGAAR